MMRLYLFLRREGLSFALLVVLEFIYRHPGCGIEEVAGAMGTTRTPVWNKVHFLRQKGLVESRRYPYGNDCRRRGMHETEKGRKLILRYFGIYGC